MNATLLLFLVLMGAAVLLTHRPIPPREYIYVLPAPEPAAPAGAGCLPFILAGLAILVLGLLGAF